MDTESICAAAAAGARSPLRLFAAMLACAALAAASTPVHGQNFPIKPIRVIVPVTPSGGTDMLARLIAAKLQERLGQPVVVENKPGAGGMIGHDYVAKSAPDGYTVMVMSNAITMVQSVYKSLPYDVMRDFAPIGIGATVPVVVVVANKVPVNTINELVSYAKANPDKLSYGTPGVGTPHHLATEWFMHMTGGRMFHVPYKGAAGMLANLLTGEVHVAFAAFPSAVPHVRAGKIRAIGIAERERLAQFKELPTVKESLPDYVVNMWFGMVAPAGTPDAVVNRLSEEQLTILNQPETRERLAGMGFDSNPSSAAEMRRIMATEIARWGTVAKAAGIEPK
ncbi:MAG: tripartite tricarboxylate transporter substrate binding protein [Betaproteobacteria bacterium]|nr:tripartite tricarboxylate transporter substrate binding protein [Betaproteobacteria bacterium]MBI2960644.1 tripartite tricarboxylate transporter substrate binding protein [Betaproteobacteria bacterium]